MFKEFWDRVALKTKETLKNKMSSESTVGIFGGTQRVIIENGEEKLIHDTRTRMQDRSDQWGDGIIRTFDEGLLDPWKILTREIERSTHDIDLTRTLHQIKRLYPGANRSRPSDPRKIMENVIALGLEEYYRLYSPPGADEPIGIEIVDTAIFSKGIFLQDILRAREAGFNSLQDIDIFSALKTAGEYIFSLHRRSAIGELLVNDIIYRKKENDIVSNPVLNIPDIIQNKSRTERSKKATDLLDFFMSLGIEMYRLSRDTTVVKHACMAIITGYLSSPDSEGNASAQSVLHFVASFAKRGKLTSGVPLFQEHNQARFQTHFFSELPKNEKEIANNISTENDLFDLIESTVIETLTAYNLFKGRNSSTQK